MNINLNYMGSKDKLLEFIEKSITKNINNQKNIIFCDLFSGSGAVARYFREKSEWKIIANDIEEVSYLSLINLIQINKNLKFWFLKGQKNVFYKLNNLVGEEGFFTNNYSPLEKKYNRQYFTIENAKKIDAIRNKIDFWKKKKLINPKEEAYLLFCLVKAVEKIANTAAIYEAYLKKVKKSASRKIKIEPIKINFKFQKGKIYKEKSENLITRIKGHILYLDPPYNSRQYSSNYHILNTLILNDNPKIKGKTGNRIDNFKSKWCTKKEAAAELENIIQKANFNQIYMSYNSEGIIPTKKIKKIFEKYGEYKVYKKKYRRFQSQKTSKIKFVTEYIHCCIKENKNVNKK